jgi:homoserine O-succinyltransferase
VFSLHGVQRQPLGKKLFGLFDCALASPHPTFLGSRSAWWEPHSRHNGLLEGELARHGYEIWSHSPRTGPDIFAKQVRSLFVFLQGHLEYDVEALLREYRRDIGRYLRGRSASYPEIPENYFAPAAVEALLAFRNQAMRNREVESLAHLPPIAAASLLHRWDDIASAFYARWLQHLAARPGRHQGAAPLNFLPQHGGGKLMRNAPA